MKILYIVLIFLFLISPIILGETSPMVDRQIFSPEQKEKKTTTSKTLSSNLPKVLKGITRLMFTGVIISPNEKFAFIRKKGNRPGDEVKGLHREGDEILGMVIKEIHSNYLILTGDGKEVRLNLYSNEKPRPKAPTPPPEPIQKNTAKPIPPSNKSNPKIDDRTKKLQPTTPKKPSPSGTNSVPTKIQPEKI